MTLARSFSPGPRSRGARRGAKAVAIAVALASAAAGCTPGFPPRDREAESAMARLAYTLDTALSGAKIADRTALTTLVRAAYPQVVQSEQGANLRYATLEAKDQRLPDDVPVALAVWERRTGADPFTDDVPRWHLQCAQLSVDRSQAALRASPVGCPRDTPEVPDDRSDELQAAPALDREAPDDGMLLVGQPAPSGAPAGPREPITRSTASFPCLEDALAATLEQLTTAGNTDEATLRIVNTSTLACVVRGPVRLLVQQGREDRRITGTAEQTEVALAPRESVTAAVSWRPGQKVSVDPQRVTVSLTSDDLPVRLGAGMPLAPVTAGVDQPLVLGPWQVSGYGSQLGDHSPAVDIAAPCEADNLAAQTSPPTGGSGDSRPPAPSVDVTNLGVATCSFGRGDLPAFQDLDGIPPFAPTPVTILRPGTQVTAPVTAAVDHRPGQLLVMGRWVPTTPG
ncbi:DUF4232 domain-containing protein [Knoellia sp. S7-12]|uniref:DUF4232 domain-containing protein n=1 Tax=Knoellia sp. S7-12 TaxID=3126698 RepID=UPI003368A181